MAAATRKIAGWPFCSGSLGAMNEPQRGGRRKNSVAIIEDVAFRSRERALHVPTPGPCLNQPDHLKMRKSFPIQLGANGETAVGGVAEVDEKLEDAPVSGIRGPVELVRPKAFEPGLAAPNNCADVQRRPVFDWGERSQNSIVERWPVLRLSIPSPTWPDIPHKLASLSFLMHVPTREQREWIVLLTASERICGSQPTQVLSPENLVQLGIRGFAAELPPQIINLFATILSSGRAATVSSHKPISAAANP